MLYCVTKLHDEFVDTILFDVINGNEISIVLDDCVGTSLSNALQMIDFDYMPFSEISLMSKLKDLAYVDAGEEIRLYRIIEDIDSNKHKSVCVGRI